ncbi:MAG TPA: cation:dicarboxylase symporter family transporter [Vicinamibacterales bacterium]|jgi:proton glutamate symport protein|nr:cation:dicarboxylase symporter family transporter [Vicinamibacterales bacterium]
MALRRPSVTIQIIAGLVVGILVGAIWPSAGVAVKPLADIFLRMIRMIVVPLVFSTLVVGIANAGDLKTMGRIGLKAIVYFEAATTIALFLGLGLVNIFRPGEGVALPAAAGAAAAMAGSEVHGWDLLVHLFPTSVFDAAARGDVLQVVVFATLFGAGLSAIGERGRTLVAVLDATAHVMFKVTGYVMMCAPIGVFAAIAATVGANGLGVLATLGKLVVLMYVALVIFAVVVLGGVASIVRVPFLKFLRAIREPVLIAFTTASSEAALPTAYECMERFGVPRSIVAFVLPAGYSFNLDGSTLYLSLCSVFVAQMAGVHLTWSQQLTMMLTLMLASKGVAGVPRGALVVLTATLGQFGLPLEGAVLLLGVDQLLDMGRTSVNVMGNCMATVVVARWEGQLS